MQGLDEEERAVEEAAIQQTKDSMDALVAEYRERYGVLVGTDFARELFVSYAESIDSRRRFARAVQRPAAAIADAVFETMVSELDRNSVLFTAGGTGAGKTSAVLENYDTVEALRDASLVFDGNFNSFKSSSQKVDRSLQQGCRVVIMFVHRHPVAAYVNGVLPRALEQGRMVTVEDHLKLHKDAIKTFIQAERHYKDNKRVSFAVITNTGTELETFMPNVDYLRSVKYDSVELAATIRGELHNALAQGNISQAIYEAAGTASGS